MRTAFFTLILTMTALAAWPDSPADPSAILQIRMVAVDDSLEYSVQSKPRDRQELEKMLMQLRKLKGSKAPPVIQIDFGQGTREIRASELLSLLDLLQSTGFTQVSVYKPNRIGMVLRRQPVVIEPVPVEKKKQ